MARDVFTRLDTPMSVIGYSTLDCTASTILCELMLCEKIRTIEDGLIDRVEQIAALLNVIPDDNLSAVLSQLAATFVGSDPLSFTNEISADSSDGFPTYVDQSVFRLFSKMVSHGPNDRVCRALRKGGAVHKLVTGNMIRYMSCLEN